MLSGGFSQELYPVSRTGPLRKYVSVLNLHSSRQVKMKSHALREKCTSINLGQGPDNLGKFHTVNHQSVLGQMRS